MNIISLESLLFLYFNLTGKYLSIIFYNYYSAIYLSRLQRMFYHNSVLNKYLNFQNKWLMKWQADSAIYLFIYIYKDILYRYHTKFETLKQTKHHDYY